MRSSRSIHALALLLLLCGLGAPPAAGQVATFHPVDEAARDPELFVLRARLIEAVQARDTTVLYEALAPDVRLGFGGESGLADFRRRWRPDAPDSELWTVLARILSLGGAFHHEGLFYAPYTFGTLPCECDPFMHVVVVGSRVRVRARPDLEAPVLASLSFAVVRTDDEPSGPAAAGWTRVRLADGRRGYLSDRFVRSPVGYRMIFTRVNGRWRVTALVAGD